MFFSSCRWSSVPWWTDGQSDKGEKIFRYDRLVDEFVSLNSFTSLQRMNTEYPAATRLLIEEVLAIGAVQEPRIEQRLRVSVWTSIWGVTILCTANIIMIISVG